MRKAISILLLVFGCFVGTASAQTGSIVITATSTPASITVDRNCNYVVLQENSATPTNAFTITLPGQSTGVTYQAGYRFVFTAGPSGFNKGQTIGTISIASGSVQFIGIESDETPTIPASARGLYFQDGGTPIGTADTINCSGCSISGTTATIVGGGSGCIPGGSAGALQKNNSGACAAAALVDNGTTIAASEPVVGTTTDNPSQLTNNNNSTGTSDPGKRGVIFNCHMVTSNGHCYGVLAIASEEASDSGNELAGVESNIRPEGTLSSYSGIYGFIAALNPQTGQTGTPFGAAYEIETNAVSGVNWGWGLRNTDGSTGTIALAQASCLTGTCSSAAYKAQGLNAGVDGPAASLSASDLGDWQISPASGQNTYITNPSVTTNFPVAGEASSDPLNFISTHSGSPVGALIQTGNTGFFNIQPADGQNVFEIPFNSATSGANFGSPAHCQGASYWNGSAAASDQWCFQTTLGTGANPTTGFSLSHNGSSGSATFSVNTPMQLPLLAPSSLVCTSSLEFLTTAGCPSGGGAFSGGSGSSFQDASEIAVPANPSAGVDRLWLDSTSHLLACHTSAGASCMPSGGSGTVTGVTLQGTANQITVSGTCNITTSGTCTFSLPNTVLLGTDASANGQLQLSNGGALGTHTILGSAATTSNTFLFPAAVFANNDLGYCAVATTVCTWTDTGVLYTNLVTAASNFTNGNLVQAAGANKTTSDSGIATANVVTAASNFTNADLVQAAGANKTTSDSGIATANVVTQSSNAAANQICAYTGANKICIPTTTLPTAAFPALTGDVTNSAGSLSTTIANGAVTGAKMANNTVTATQLAAQYSKRACPFGMGDGTNAITAATYPSSGQMLQCVNNSGVTWTITGIHCFTDNAGTSTLNVYNNAGTSLLTGAITCNATKTSGGAAGTQSATTTIANTDGINFVFVADGTSKYVTATVDFTY